MRIIFFLLLCVAGFVFGYLWGNSARNATADNLDTDISGGIVTVRFNAFKTAVSGLRGLFQ